MTAGGRAFSSVSIADLVAEAGIGRATFYLYFEDRTAFVLRLLRHARDQIEEPLRVIWSELSLDRETLTTAIRTIVFRFHDSAAIISSVIEAAAVDQRVAAQLDEEMERFIETGTTVLQAAQAAGVIRPEVRPAETAAALSWMTERVCYQAVRQAEPQALEGIAQALAAIVWHSLQPDSETSKDSTLNVKRDILGGASSPPGAGRS